MTVRTVFRGVLLCVATTMLVSCAHRQGPITITLAPTATCHHQDGAPANVAVCGAAAPAN